jgi:hypothetical protein
VQNRKGSNIQIQAGQNLENRGCEMKMQETENDKKNTKNEELGLDRAELEYQSEFFKDIEEVDGDE